MKKAIIAAIALITISMSTSAYAGGEKSTLSKRDEKSIEKILSNLDKSIELLKAGKPATARDCIADCAKAYDTCRANAVGPIEQAVCKTDYTNCVINC